MLYYQKKVGFIANNPLKIDSLAIPLLK